MVNFKPETDEYLANTTSFFQYLYKDEQNLSS